MVIEREETTLPRNTSHVLGGGKGSRGMDLSECADDDVENEENSPSSKEAGRQRERVDSRSIWKTSLCSYFRRPPGGVCRHGKDCRFAHGEAELRPRHDNSWDPTSERAKKLLKTNNGYAKSVVPDEDEDEDDAVDLIALDKCLIGLPKKWASENLKSFLGSQEISYVTAKKKKGMTVGFVSFEDAEQVKNAIEVLRENPLNCKQVKVADANCGQQKKNQMMKIAMCTSSTANGSILAYGDDVTVDTPNTEGIVTKTKAVCDVVTPLGRMPYKDQLDHKRNSLSQTLKRLTRNARKACPGCVSLPEWVLKSREIGGLPCKFEGILESPIIDGYRNKCEFSVGCSLEGKQTVGFMLGNFRNGVTAVEEPHNCPNISRLSCKYARLFQDFIQSSELPVWNRIDNSGFWRQFTVREGRCFSQVAHESVGIDIAEVMLIVQVCSLHYEEEQIRREFNRMTQALVHGAAACSPPLPLTTVLVQDHRGISNVAPANCPLITLQLPMVDDICGSGVICTTEARIHDCICNLRFSISPTAFFQVNTLAAERLYSLAGDWGDLTPDTILFDICCGTGTIGLTLAHRVGMVVGIEMNETAVSDANRNAEINGIKNCRFICGKAEDVMGSILNEYLDAPQHHGVVSDDKGISNVPNVENETNKVFHKEDLQDDTGASSEVSTADPINEMLPCVEDNLTEEISDSQNNVDGDLEQLLTVSDNSSGITGNCAAECIATKLNQESRDTRDGGCDISNNIVNFKHNLESFILEENTVTNIAVHQFKRVVVIVDPPRVGLHPIVIKALRTHPCIRRLVYISCNPETLMANAIELCTPTADKTEKGKGNIGWRKMSNAGLARNRVKSMPSSEAFRPIKAVGVDLFPHTPHCEMVMLLER
ncbi:Zinc finger CCCH domain-containing protein 24 [Platanthera zijinensis]|uniref:Zinc finger CCCH domain-containing protein 24 n=1 Tax=Platanthera zijinensis TaxID=2320716 RepID=A0AAP0G6B7_9ASPA